MKSLKSLSTRTSVLAPIWFALATFWCSALIFWAEPLVGKQLLPQVGGAPAVWNVCLLFFQCTLLAGYALAHALSRLSSVRAQLGIYLAIAALAAFTLPVDFTSRQVDPAHPTLWVLGQLTLTLFVPFVALAAASPILQYWYSRLSAASARDPYFLYAASNAGSLLALVAYPFLVEPAFRISGQNRAWAALFATGILMVALSALYADRNARTSDPVHVTAGGSRPSGLDIGIWMLLAAVPSSMLLGVTSFITSDLAPVPLLWVVPLAIYLLTFILAFAGGPFGRLRAGPVGGIPKLLQRIIIVAVLVWCAMYRVQADDPADVVVSIHLVVFALLALGVHARLAQRRPEPAHLTTYYLAIAAGGALGGAFNALLAPLLFTSFIEYPIAVVAATLAILYRRGSGLEAQRDLLPIGAAIFAIGFGLMLTIEDQLMKDALSIGIPLILALAFSGRALRLVIMVAAILISGTFDTSLHDRVLHSSRNFFGRLAVTSSTTGRYRELLHGKTLHGTIDTKAIGGSPPLSYYWVGSPVADVIRSAQERRDSMNVAIVGLGVGAVAWYARPGERWTFYEINPEVVSLARDPAWFHFLANSRADRIDIVLGDARMKLREAPAASYDLILLDAFTSDAIPIHILTREAVELYVSKLRPGGTLVFHLSNQYLDLQPVVAAVGRSVGLRPFFRFQQVTRDQSAERAEASMWMVMVRDRSDFPLWRRNSEWLEVRGPDVRVWTDDYSNVWSAFIK